VTNGAIIFREATGADMPGITRVRVSVVENALTIEQLEERGVTEAGVAASFLADSKGWVALQGDEIIAFSIADRATHSIFALFVFPGYEGRGIGSELWIWRSAGYGRTAPSASG
jgi:GNAT superfamily N-acetyltransferase